MGDRSMTFLTEAILALRPGAQFSTNGDIIIWHDTEQDQPSDSDIAAKEAEYMHRDELFEVESRLVDCA